MSKTMQWKKEIDFKNHITTKRNKNNTFGTEIANGIFGKGAKYIIQAEAKTN